MNLSPNKLRELHELVALRTRIDQQQPVVPLRERIAAIDARLIEAFGQADFDAALALPDAISSAEPR